MKFDYYETRFCLNVFHVYSRIIPDCLGGARTIVSCFQIKHIRNQINLNKSQLQEESDNRASISVQPRSLNFRILFSVFPTQPNLTKIYHVMIFETLFKFYTVTSRKSGLSIVFIAVARMPV